MMLEYCNREGSLSNSYEHQDEIKKRRKKSKMRRSRRVGRSSHGLEAPYPGGMLTSTQHSRFHACKKIPATATGGGDFCSSSLRWS